MNSCFSISLMLLFALVSCTQPDTDAIASSYFSDKTPLLTSLDYNLIHTFILEPEALCIIFQPYTVAGITDSPPTIKIPYDKLKAHWNPSNPLVKCVPFTPTDSWTEISEESLHLRNNRAGPKTQPFSFLTASFITSRKNLIFLIQI